MKIKWYGHAAFLLTTATGTRIIIDPYRSGAFGGALSYGKITDEADVVLTSHDHDDHNYTDDIGGKFQRLAAAGTYELEGLTVRAVETFHDASEGKERGENLVFVVEADGLRVVHLGDLGHALSTETLRRIGRADVLLIPVGGFYTIDAKEAALIMGALGPAVTVPMHFKTEKCDFPIAGVEEFVKGKSQVRVAEGAEIEVTKEGLPKTPEIIVLRHAL